MPNDNTIIFVGNIVSEDEAKNILPSAIIYPPASMGDMYRYAEHGVDTVVFIDGTSDGSPAVWHREILDVMADGVRVIGAAGAGAVRAAELEPFGMIGYGKVFEWLCDGTVKGDHEILSGEDCISIVNLEYILRNAAIGEFVQPERSSSLLEFAASINSRQRSISSLLESQEITHWPNTERKYLEEALNSDSLQKTDALGALRKCAELKAPPPRFSIYKRCISNTFYPKWDTARALFSSIPGKSGHVTGKAVVEEAMKDSSLTGKMWNKLSKRRFLLDYAGLEGVHCAGKEIDACLENHHVSLQIDDPDSWMRANGLTSAVYRRLISELALEKKILRIHRNGINAGKIQSSCGIEIDIVQQWGVTNGVLADANTCAGKISDGQDIVNAGPAHFGMIWDFTTALLRELQLTGLAQKLAQGLKPERE